MDAVIGNMRTTIGTSVRKIFSNNPGNKNINTDKGLNNEQDVKMSLCQICETESCDVPFIVRDICKFISEKSIKLEGIFRVSAPVRQINELRDLYESNTNLKEDMLLNQEVTEVTGHAAAGLLKQFFRHLTEPLIHGEILQVFLDSKTISDKDFCEKVSRCMDKWPPPHRCTLTFLLTFLHTVAQESENRMSVNGLAVVFGPNVFRLPDGVEGLQAQAIANQTFDRLLSCSQILSKKQTPVLKKREPPPRPAPPAFRPLPPTPLEESLLSGETCEQKESEVSVEKPVPAVRTSIGSLNNDKKQALNINAMNQFEAMPYIDATPDTGVTNNPLDKSHIVPCNGSAAQPDAMPQKNFAMPQMTDVTTNYKMELPEKYGDTPQKTVVVPRTEAAPAFIDSTQISKNSSTSSEEIPEEILETSESIEEGKSENKAGDSRNILDNIIRQIIQTRLFNSTESSSVSDEADSALKTHDLLPATTAGRVAGPRNRRRPARTNRLLNNVHLEDDSGDDDAVAKATNTEQNKTDYDIAIESGNCEMSNLKSPQTIAVTSTSTSVALVMTPDSGCIVEDSDYPRNSSPIKSELARLDIGRSLSPVYIPKLDLRNSLDEEDMSKFKDSLLPSTGDIVPQLDLSSVTETVDNADDLKPLKKRELDAQKLSETSTPPKAAAKHAATKHGARKKKKRSSHNHQIHKISEVTPQASDCEVIDENCDETMEETRDKMLNVLRDNRRAAGRPFDVARMSFENLKDEKLSMQRELLKFESRHGRPTTKQSKQLMREVYDRYRAVKRLLAAGRAVDENENAIKHELEDSFLVTRPFPIGSSVGNNSCEDSDVTNEGLLDSPVSDILDQVHEMRGRRRKLRRILREFETERKAQGSNLERRVMRTEYDEYRSIKNKLRNLEIALAKKGVEIP
ncbi:protein FAM13B-like isoform X2 [Styela clava]